MDVHLDGASTAVGHQVDANVVGIVDDSPNQMFDGVDDDGAHSAGVSAAGSASAGASAAGRRAGSAGAGSSGSASACAAFAGRFFFSWVASLDGAPSASARRR